jgi:hypothetical protein
MKICHYCVSLKIILALFFSKIVPGGALWPMGKLFFFFSFGLYHCERNHFRHDDKKIPDPVGNQNPAVQPCLFTDKATTGNMYHIPKLLTCRNHLSDPKD